MRVLADTHIILWALKGDEKLSKEAKKILADPANDLYCSVASIWEVAIKHMAFITHDSLIPQYNESCVVPV